MKDLGIPVTSTAVVFGQSYGMCDYISYILGKNKKANFSHDSQYIKGTYGADGALHISSFTFFHACWYFCLFRDTMYDANISTKAVLQNWHLVQAHQIFAVWKIFFLGA